MTWPANQMTPARRSQMPWTNEVWVEEIKATPNYAKKKNGSSAFYLNPNLCGWFCASYPYSQDHLQWPRARATRSHIYISAFLSVYFLIIAHEHHQYVISLANLKKYKEESFLCMHFDCRWTTTPSYGLVPEGGLHTQWHSLENGNPNPSQRVPIANSL